MCHARQAKAVLLSPALSNMSRFAELDEARLAMTFVAMKTSQQWTEAQLSDQSSFRWPACSLTCICSRTSGWHRITDPLA